MRTFLLLALVAMLVLVSVSGMPTESRSVEKSIFDASELDLDLELAELAEVADLEDAAPATAKAFIHQSGIDLIQTIVNQILTAALKSMHLPDIEDKILHGKVTLSNIILQNVQFAAQQVGLIAPNQVSIILNNFQGEIDLDWRYKAKLLKDHGSGKVNFAKTSINVLFSFASDAAGRPALTLNSCVVDIDDLDVHLSGAGAWIVNALIKLFKSKLKSAISAQITAVATAQFQAILQTIQTNYPLTMPMPAPGFFENMIMNSALVPNNAFAIGGSYLVVGTEFSFASTTNTTADARAHETIPDAFPLNPATGQPTMFGLAMDEFFLGSLLWSLTENGKFDFVVDNDSLNPSSLIKLNTKLLETVYPKLYAAYPSNNLSVSVVQASGAPPLAITTTNGSEIANAVTLVLSVIDPTQATPLVPVCSLLVNFSLATQIQLGVSGADVLLTGSVTPFIFDATLTWAAIEPDQFAGSVQVFVTSLVDVILLPVINAFLAKGIAVPKPAGLKSIFLNYGDHVLSIGMDLGLSAQETSELASLAEEMIQYE